MTDMIGNMILHDCEGTKVTATIFLPKHDTITAGGIDWSCQYVILRNDAEEILNKRAFGVDSLQSIMLAIEGIRQGLIAIRPKLVMHTYDFGFPRFLPHSHDDGDALYKRVEAFMEREMMKENKKLENRNQKK